MACSDGVSGYFKYLQWYICNRLREGILLIFFFFLQPIGTNSAAYLGLSALIQLKPESLQEAFLFSNYVKTIFSWLFYNVSLFLQLTTIPIVFVKTSCLAYNLLSGK